MADPLKLPKVKGTDPTHTILLKREYGMKLGKLYDTFKEEVIIRLRPILGRAERSGIMGRAFEIIDETAAITIYEPSHKIIQENVTKGYAAGKKAASRNPRVVRAGLTIPYQLNMLDQMVVQDLAARNFGLVTNATEKMKAEMLRTISEGIRQQKGTYEIANKLKDRVDKVGKSRAKMIARTEIAFSYNNAVAKTYQREGIEKWQWLSALLPTTAPEDAARHGMVFAWTDPQPPAHPNSYDKETEIYTKEGWKSVMVLEPGDYCLSLNPETFDLEYVPVIRTISHSESIMIHFHNRTFDLMVTPDHDMFYQTDWNSKYHKDDKSTWGFVKAKDIAAVSCGRFYRSSQWVGKNPSKVTLGDRKIPIDLYARFMGWFLSEGSVFPSRNLVYISQNKKRNPEKWELIQELLDELGMHYYEQERGFGITDEQLANQLQQFGRSHERYIPEVIKNATPEIIRTFLEAYRLGDGNIKKGKRWKGGNFEPSVIYSTSSKRMADDLGELILKIHKRPSFHLRKTKGTWVKFKNGIYQINKDIWIVSECNTQYARMDHMNVDIVDYDDYAYCVELEKYHLLFVRRNGKVCWSGNCVCTIYPVVDKTFKR